MERLARLIQVDARWSNWSFSACGTTGRTERAASIEVEVVVTTSIGPEEYPSVPVAQSDTAGQVDETLAQAGFGAAVHGGLPGRAANRSLFESIRAQGAADRLSLRSSLSAPLASATTRFSAFGPTRPS